MDSIRNPGLMSTENLLNLLGISSEQREDILTKHRLTSIVLKDGISIRDQSPMPPSAVVKTLPTDKSPSDWYRLMNSFVFLWPSRERVDRHRAAHGGKVDLSLLILDAEKLFHDYPDCLYLSPINSGFALRKAAKRSEETTFVPYSAWQLTGWPTATSSTAIVEGKKAVRSRTGLPVEVAVRGVIPLEKYLVAIE